MYKLGHIDPKHFLAGLVRSTNLLSNWERSLLENIFGKDSFWTLEIQYPSNSEETIFYIKEIAIDTSLEKKSEQLSSHFSIQKSFEGRFQDAETFAQKHHLAELGIHLLVSPEILPYKWIIEDKKNSSDSESLENKHTFTNEQAHDGIPFPISLPGESKSTYWVRARYWNKLLQELPPSLNTLIQVLPTPILHHYGLIQQGVLNRKNHEVSILVQDNYTCFLLYKEGVLQDSLEMVGGKRLLEQEEEVYQKKMVDFVSSDAKNFIGIETPWDCYIQSHSDSVTQKTYAALSQSLFPKPSSIRCIPNTDNSILYGSADANSLPTIYSQNIKKKVSPERWKQATQKISRYSLWALFLMGIGVGTLLVGTFVLSLWTKADVQVLKQQEGELRSLKEKQKLARKNVYAMSALLNRKTRSAETLELLAQSLPQKVWLSNLDLRTKERRNPQNQKSKSPTKVQFQQYTLSGYAYSDDHISEFLECLENTQHFTSIQLKVTE